MKERNVSLIFKSSYDIIAEITKKQVTSVMMF